MHLTHSLPQKDLENYPPPHSCIDLACGRGFISLRSSPIHLRYGPHLRSRADLTQKNNPPPLQLTAHDSAETRFEDAFANRTDSDQWAYLSVLWP